MGEIYMSILLRPLLMTTPTTLVVLITTILIVASLAQIGWNKNKKMKTTTKKIAGDEMRMYKMPPGRRGWPLVGDTFSWLNAVAGSHPPRFVHQQAKRFGKIFSCNLFGKRSVVSVDPAFNRFIMQNEGKLFQSSYPKSFRDLVGRNGVITVHGDRQRKLHAIATNVMRLDKLGSLLVDDIQLVMTRVLSDFGDNQVIHLQDVCRKVAINLMVNQLFGTSSEREVNEMAQSFSDFSDGCLSVPINLPGFAYHTSMKARERIICKISKIIDEHRSGRAGEGSDGVLGRLVDEESLAGEKVLADFVINLLFAGNETTAKTMLFAVYFLTGCPTALKQILEEHDGLRSKSEGNGLLTWQDYKSMTFTQCVIDETLRLGGIAIWLMREAREDVIYQDYYIPKGSFVVPFLSAVHLDENIYPGARNFNPWRWMDSKNQDKRNWRSSPFYSPFGGGARFCPGAELARLQIALFLHYFVTTYRWTQVKEDRMSFFPSARLVNGFQIRLNQRQRERLRQ